MKILALIISWVDNTCTFYSIYKYDVVTNLAGFKAPMV